MEMDTDYFQTTKEALEKSLRLLESSTGGDQPLFHSASIKSHSDSFNRSKMEDIFQSTRIKTGKDMIGNVFDTDVSITLLPGELSELKMLNETKSFRLNPAAKSAQDRLFTDFMEAWQRAGSSPEDVFSAVLDFIQCCSDAIDIVRNSEDRTLARLTDIDQKRVLELESERNTWKLIYSLYQDRILTMAAGEEMDDDLDEDLEKVSEKEIMEKLYKKECSIREWQIVIDWLEGNASESVTSPGLEGFTDKAVAWENTLHELQNKRQVSYRSTRELISELDPDAPRRQNKHLHDMDQEDEDRLCQQVLKEIRCGHLESAQSICVHAGQPWRAAILEGWKLYHDPNYSRLQNPVYRDASPVEGNPNRDIWKLCAWRMCEDGNMPLKARAALAAYCGHLPTLLAVSTSWEDCLWSYLKTIVDIRVEREIRTYSYKTYVDMPANYWNNEVTLETVFNEIVAHKDGAVRKVALAPDHVVQMTVITDNVQLLVEQVSKWILGSDMSVGNDSESVSPHFLRFLAHLILFLRQIGRSENDAVGDSVIEAYVKLLIEKKDCELVAWYVSQLPQDDQIYYYSSFLEEITETEERENALKAAIQAGLNVDLITKTVVENIRQQPCNVDSVGLDIQEVSPEDWAKISALDWLTFSPAQRLELVLQANSLIAFFLASGNVLAARMTFNKVPEGTIGQIQTSQSLLEDDDFINIALENVPKNVALATKEYLCYKAYLDSDESFSDWFQHFHHAKPVEPVLPPGYTFIEKIGFQHNYKQYKIDLERWNLTMENQTETTKKLLFNVLTFPLGWLVDDTEADDPDRGLQMNGLRSVIIPKVTFLLHLVMHSMGDYSGCLALADLIASQQRKLYKLFNKQRLQDLLQKMAESSLALMNKGKDPWGFPLM